MNFWMPLINLYFHKPITLLFLIHFQIFLSKVHIFGIFTWALLNMDLIAFNTWILLPFNPWYRRKLKF